MTRRVALIAAILLLMAAPALAKGADGVTLSAGDQVIVLEWSSAPGTDGDLQSLVRATHLYDVDWWQGDRHERPTGELGPVIVAEWTFPEPVNAVVVQHLYPLADGGPVGHVLADQAYLDMTIVGAWHPLRPEILDVLATIGLDTSRLESAETSGLLFGGLLLLGSAIIAGRLRQVA